MAKNAKIFTPPVQIFLEKYFLKIFLLRGWKNRKKKPLVKWEAKTTHSRLLPKAESGYASRRMGEKIQRSFLIYACNKSPQN